MKLKFFYFLLLLLVLGCKKSDVVTINGWSKISERIQYQENGDFLELKSGKFSYKIPKSKLPFKRIVLLNASLVGYFTELGIENKIVGISSPEYIFSEKIRNLVKEDKIANVGNEQKYDIEKILSLKPSVVFTNYVENFENTYALLQKNGIEVIFIDEYLEKNPLERSKIIEIFGKLLGKEKEAKQVYTEVEKSYNSYKNLAKLESKMPSVLTNEIYGNQWFVAGGNSQVAHFIKDAAGLYIFGDNTESKSMPKSFEEVFAKAENATFWVNVGNHKNKKELLQVNPNYAKMKVYQKGKLYALTAKEKENSNDFFESGVVRADLVLKDYIKIFHPKIFPNYQLTYMKELK